MKDVLEALEYVMADAVANGEEIKFGKLMKIFLKDVPQKECFDGLNKVYKTREAKRVPKVKLLSQLKDIELPPKKSE